MKKKITRKKVKAKSKLSKEAKESLHSLKVAISSIKTDEHLVGFYNHIADQVMRFQAKKLLGDLFGQD